MRVLLLLLRLLFLLSFLCSGCCIPGRKVTVIVVAAAPLHRVECAVQYEDQLPVD